MIVPVGTTNLAAIGVPNVITQIVPPNPLLNGVPTNIIGVVGTGTWGAVNSPITTGSLTELIANFGQPQNATYDLGTQVYTAYLQGASNFVCVRVTDGTDVQALIANSSPLPNGLLDVVNGVGAILNALYTGVVGNTLNANISVGSNSTNAAPTYKLTVWLSGGVPEVFDNIGGTGSAFWNNLVTAVNMGSGPQRGPSNLVQAGIASAPSSVTIRVPGAYATLPTMTATIGTGATFALTMFAVSAIPAPGNLGTGYAVNDTITLAGSTGTEPVLTVTSIGAGGAVGTVSVTTPGAATVLAANPVSQGSTSGGGTAAEFAITWGILSATVSGGTGYTQNSEVIVTGGGDAGGAQAVLVLTPSPSTHAPLINPSPYVFAGGTNGNSGVSDATVIGSDVSQPRSGMYALRGKQCSVAVVADQVNPSYWQSQIAFGVSEGIYMLASFANQYDQNIGGAIAIKQTFNIADYAMKLMLGDWCQINDPFNNVFRMVSPLGFVAGILTTQLPNNSSLNKVLSGIVATQKTLDQQSYSNADLSQLQTGGIDVVTSPIPASMNAYGARLGINTSGNVTTIGDNYATMVNFLSETIDKGLGQFIGLPQSVDVQNQARATLQGFLQNIQNLGLIGTLNGSPAYSVILDSSNNPPTQVALGYMVANVSVTLWSIIFQFVVNLQAGQSVQIQVLPPQLI